MNKAPNSTDANALLDKHSVETLEKRIALLERKISREKKARNAAEQRLELYSLDIYQANQSLQEALTYSTKKQSELEYLARASADVSSELPMNEMVKSLVELTCQYCNANYGFYVVTEAGNLVSENLDNTWNITQGWQIQSDLQKLVNDNLPLDETNLLESWFVSPVNDASNIFPDKFVWILYMNFSLSDGQMGWLAFLSQEEYVDEDIFPVLATARDNLTSGIRRRLTDVRILKRNMQLQNMVNTLENTKRQLIQSEKMASLGQLAAGVAHEINNPVAFIRSNMEVLKEYHQDYLSLHEELHNKLKNNSVLDMSTYSSMVEKIDLEYIEKDCIELITSNIDGLNRVKEIVENLKGYSHAADTKLVEMSLNECVSQALNVVGNVFKYEHQVTNLLTAECPTITGNNGQLQQVFVNLFVNAAYAMEKGGELEVSQTVNNDRVIIHVKDSGVGMDNETLSKLFTPFFTTKPVGVGTGLGLSVSYAILEAHGVQVNVDSVVGLGTTFNLSFPLIRK